MVYRIVSQNHWRYVGAMTHSREDEKYSHVMVIAADGKRKATLDTLTWGICVGIFQCTARKHGLLRVVESNCTKLFPVAD